ncbi:NUDIX hydrolase [Planococcus salinarum]|uniref:NUDIX hydrolase n=1 Tax=Planococcus salinarum TaxID=622695 RepID=UPI000E3CD682|nr:NUDIX domain-containing protein [Planococcus salinarum]TAA72703.1 NUDIX domain-containing protein [Planococcus salinarum]
MRSRAALLIVDNGHLALIKRICDDETYYVFPGGGIEAGELPQAAAEREALEELGVKVEMGPQVFLTIGSGKEYYFLASITEGRFGSGSGEEYTDPERGRGSYKPVWVPVEMLTAISLYPEALAVAVLRQYTAGELQYNKWA